MKQMQPGSAALLVILAATLARLVLAAGMGLGIDESYMVAAAHTFQLSYFDHPPVSWWMELGIQRLTGLHTPFIVRLPFIATFAATSGLMYGLTRRLFSPAAGLWAVIGLNISPVFSFAFGTWVLPDGPLDAFLVGAAWALARALGIGRTEQAATPDPEFWPLAGILIGLAMASKYNAVLVLAGALLFLLVDARGRRALATPGPWVACVLAAGMFSPVVIWNALNGWASFGYQGDRAAGLALHPLRPFAIWGGEALFVAPWIFVPMIGLLIGGLLGRDRRARLLAWLGLVPVALFSVIGLWSSRKILFHWAAPGYLMLFPLLGDWVVRQRGALLLWIGRAAAGTAALLAVAVLFIAVQVRLGIVPGFDAMFPPGKSPTLQAIDWTSFRASLKARGQLDRPGLALAALRWFDAGKIAYAVGPGMRMTVFEGNPHEFGVTTPPRSLIGENILIAAMPGSVSAIETRYAPRFRSITVEPPIDIVHDGHVLLRVPVLMGHDLLSWPAARR